MERRKFLQLIGVGIVATIARLTTGGGGGDEEQPALPEPEKPKGGYLVPDKFKNQLLGGGHRGGKSHAQMQQVIKDHKPGQRVQRILKMNGVPATIEFTQTPEDPDSWHELIGTIQGRSIYSTEELMEDAYIIPQSISILAKYT